MVLAPRAESRLAARVLPAPLYRALTHAFVQRLQGVMLVGGTGLAGYYAGHRRSDDLDLFTQDALAQREAVLAVKSLDELGTTFVDERSSAYFYHATCRLDAHYFTAKVVLDRNLFTIGASIDADDGVVVATAETLLKTKAATLVSRASEKDLYDLAWFFAQDEQLDVPRLIALGKEVDGGVNAEAVLVSLVGTEMRESACDFSLTRSPKEVLEEVTRVRNGLIQGVETFLRNQPPPPIAELVRRLR